MFRLKTFRSFGFLVATFVLVLVYLSCKKSEQPVPVPASSTAEKKGFFKMEGNIDPAVTGIVNALNRENEKSPFAEVMVRNAGSPQWTHSVIKSNANLKGETTDELINIPLVKGSEKSTTAILAVNVVNGDTTYDLIYPQEYILYNLDDSSGRHKNLARDFFNVFANFDYALFGTTQYFVYDGRLFGFEKNDTLLVTVQHSDAQQGRQQPGSVSGANASDMTVCTSTTACVVVGRPISARANEALANPYQKCVTTTSCIIVVGGGGPAGPTSPSGPSGPITSGNGSTTTGAGNTTIPTLTGTPCARMAIANAKNPVTDPCGTQPWTPIIYDNVIDPCLRKMVEAAISRDCRNQIVSFIQGTFHQNPDMDLEFKDAALGTDDGKTNYTQNGAGDYIHIYITLNSNPLALPRASCEYIAITILHEAVHTWIDVKAKQSVAGTISHEQMTSAANINLMASALQEMYPSISLQDAQDLAWGGLQFTTGWTNLTQADKDRITQTNYDYKIHAKGAPCN